MQHCDTIIIGAGHNGLVCAAYLARSGQRVLVLEAGDTLGGLAATRTFHPGFKASVAQSMCQFPNKIVRDLDLTSHGYQPGDPLATTGLSETGEHVTITGDKVTGVKKDDATAYARYRKKMLRYAGVLKPFSLKTIPRIGHSSFKGIMTFAKMGLDLRRLGREDMRGFLRIISLPARDLMDENFDNDLLKAMLSWDGLIGSKMAPRSPNHAVWAMLHRMTGELGGAHMVPAGGINGLISALSAAATAAGASIRTGARVSRILIDGGADGLTATGVELEGGEQFKSNRIISAADPQHTFLTLVGVDNLEIQFTNRIRRLRCKGYVAKLHLALAGLPEFTGLAHPDGRMIIAPDMDAIEFAFDDAKYGQASERPVLEVIIPSLQNPSMAPTGQHVLSAHVMYVPHDRKGGWQDEARHQLCERVIDTISRYAPGIKKQIIHRQLLTPADIAKTYNVTGGHWHHTELAIDQMLMMRPTYEAAQYATPIAGLYLAGAGCHPGGGLMGGPGHNAAHEILK